MNKTNEYLLAQYKKANKERRARIVELAGLKTEGEYLGMLTGVSVPEEREDKTVVSNVTAIRNIYILDVSGSMAGGKLNSAIKGIDSEMSELAKLNDGVANLVAVVPFDYAESIRIPVIRPASSYAGVGYYGGGGTALYDALGYTLQWLIQNTVADTKTIVKVFTDGGENCSRSFNQQTVANLIKVAEANNITIAFVGTSYDVGLMEQRLGLRKDNTLVHDNTASGVGMAFKKMSDSTMAYRSSAIAGEAVLDGFFSKKVGKL